MRQFMFFVIFFAVCVSAKASDTMTANIDNVIAMRAEDAIVIDGILSENIWSNGHGVSAFTQREPVEYGTPSEQTIVRVAYDDKALFIGARMYDSAPDSIIAHLGRRDTYLSSDHFIFFIDPYYDRRSGFYFMVNAGGTISDGVLLNDDWDDDSWDGVWEADVAIDEQGWTAEMRIPYSQLRFQQKDKYTWGVNFKRVIQRKNEMDYLVFTPKDGSGFVSRFVDLVGVEKISLPRNLEILPYARSKAEFTHPDSDDPFNDGSRVLPALGVDLKYGIGSNLTLDLTINPDFGQVEVDPAVVNLSDIETFYDEKRPFFIEGSSIFNFGQGGSRSYWGFNWSNPDFFYSRRIGRAPQGSLPDNDYARAPEGTTILGAAKMTGKVGNNWNIGTIHALTGREVADVQYEGVRSTHEVEPLTYYGVFRGQKEFAAGRQGLGLISTMTKRHFQNGVLQDDVNRAAYTLGVDGWTFLDADKEWVVSGWSGMTQIRGTMARMIDLQQSSRHYHQRPDASHVSIDSAATSMTGYATRITLNKQKGAVLFNSALGVIDPNFDLNDIGFIWRGDVINGHIGAGYKWTKPNRISRYSEAVFAVFQSYDFEWNNIWGGIFAIHTIQFLNYYQLETMFAYNPQSINNRRTRGGPLTLNRPGWELNVSANTDERKAWVFNCGTSGYTCESGSWSREFEFGVEWKPATNLSVSVTPQYAYEYENAQWVENFDDPFATATYNHRYVFAKFKLNELSSSIRLNWTFTPKLSFQLYVQPLISAGEYYQFKELARPKSYDFKIYGRNNSTINMDEENDEYIIDPDGAGAAESFSFENPDFNYKSLRGNAVLRWEYRPGSVLYFVWTQSRSESEEIGDFRFQQSMDRLLSLQSDNIFMIKLTYWLNK